MQVWVPPLQSFSSHESGVKPIMYMHHSFPGNADAAGLGTTP